jgi:hypothetical protein
MLNKEQALAAMDAQIIRVEAERKKRLERRTGLFTRLYPALRNAPLEEREAIVERARKHSIRRWPLYAIATLALAGIAAAMFLPDDALKSEIVLRVSLCVLAAELVLAAIFYSHMRSFIARDVAARFTQGTEKVSAPGA